MLKLSYSNLILIKIIQIMELKVLLDRKNNIERILICKIKKELSGLKAPLGLLDSEIPKTSDFGTEIICFYNIKNVKIKGVSIVGIYR